MAGTVGSIPTRWVFS